MAADPLPRRIRTAPPERRVRRLALTEADVAIFEAIDRHGPLPTSYLYEFTRHLRTDRSHLQNRLTEFYNGDAGGSYLTRPPQQFASFRARYQHLVYDLTPRARRLLAERGSAISYAKARCDPFVHRLMTACVSASIELTAPLHGIRHIGFQSILEHSNCNASRSCSNPLALCLPSSAKISLIPDLVFGLEYPGVGFRFFAVEIDRNTESIERRNLGQSAFARKLAGYEAALSTRAYEAWWGLPNLSVLTVTTSVTHGARILRHVEECASQVLKQKFCIMALPTFGSDWRVPTALLRELLGSPWNAVGRVRSLARSSG